MSTEKQTAFLDALFGEAKGDAKKAIEIAGYAEGTAISAVIGSEKIQEEIAKRTREHINLSVAKAFFKMENLLDAPATLGAKEIIVAAKDLMDRGGLGKTEKLEVKNANPIFIVPAKEESRDDI